MGTFDWETVFIYGCLASPWSIKSRIPFTIASSAQPGFRRDETTACDSRHAVRMRSSHQDVLGRDAKLRLRPLCDILPELFRRAASIERQQRRFGFAVTDDDGARIDMVPNTLVVLR